MESLYILKLLSTVFGPSTCEDEVLNTIKCIMGDEYRYLTTPHKNLLVIPLMKNRPKKTIFLQAHTDELGFRPYRYLKDGFIELTPLGGIPISASHQKLQFHPSGIQGMLLIQEVERQKKFYADIGAENEKEAQEIVPFYSNAAYVGTFQTSSSLLTGKSFDDRAGCASIINVLMSLPQDRTTQVIGLFTSREETGNWPIPEIVNCCRQNDLWPDLIINMEVCPGGPTPVDNNPAAYLGKGVVFAHADRYYSCQSSLCRYMAEIAEKSQILHQQMNIRSGGGEIGSLAFAFGALGYSLAIPVRYMHDPYSVMAKRDYHSAIDILKSTIADDLSFMNS